MVTASTPVQGRGRVTYLAGWGRIGRTGVLVESANLARDSTYATLFRGLGRSYGDSAVPARDHDLIVATPPSDRILSFDRATGLIRAEAGLSLKALNDLFLPQGWFVPVSPGTQFVTLGGMVAADVHGKNHHVAGTFGAHVRSLLIRVADGRLIECGPEREAELFWATVGGMGLTGHILEVEFKLDRIETPWIWSESRRIESLAEFTAALKEAARVWPFTVGWIDTLTRGEHMGRGILICGRWARRDEAPPTVPEPKSIRSVPVVAPEFVLSRPAIRLFNAVYYRAHPSRPRARVMHPADFFYPLDAIGEWNRLYGPRGFTQYQCLIPETGSGDAAARFFDTLTQLGGSSFLSVIKDCGAEGKGLLSFPKPGISIALDIPIRSDTPALVAALNRELIKLGGRIYLAKDLFTTAEDFRAMEPRLPNWMAIRRKWDPEGRLRSAQSVRILGDPV